MQNEEMVKKLNELLMLDRDAVKAYSSAMERISILFVKDRLSEFRSDHQRHIRELSACILKMGGEPKDRVDFKGPFIQAMTALRSLMGNEQAIRAMQSNEELTHKKYGEALQFGFSDAVLELVRRNYQDEVRHLAWINECIERRVWDQSETEAHP